MAERPKWVRALYDFVCDEVLDEKYDYPMDGSDDALHDKIETVVKDILCGHYGHDIDFDQCGIPEHRYCYLCGRLESTIKEREAF